MSLWVQELKSELPGGAALNCRVRQQRFEHVNTVEEYLGVQRTLQREAEIKEFEQSSKRIEYLFLGGITGLYVAVALFDLFSRANHFAI